MITALFYLHKERYIFTIKNSSNTKVEETFTRTFRKFHKFDLEQYFVNISLNSAKLISTKKKSKSHFFQTIQLSYHSRRSFLSNEKILQICLLLNVCSRKMLFHLK